MGVYISSWCVHVGWCMYNTLMAYCWLSYLWLLCLVNVMRRFCRGVIFLDLPRPGLIATPPVWRYLSHSREITSFYFLNIRTTWDIDVTPSIVPPIRHLVCSLRYCLGGIFTHVAASLTLVIVSSLIHVHTCYSVCQYITCRSCMLWNFCMMRCCIQMQRHSIVTVHR